jgi:hypothetical protein
MQALLAVKCQLSSRIGKYGVEPPPLTAVRTSAGFRIAEADESEEWPGERHRSLSRGVAFLLVPDRPSRLPLKECTLTLELNLSSLSSPVACSGV